MDANKAVDDDQFQSAKHFDGENFAGGQNRVVELRAQVIAGVQADDASSARIALGSALHGIQDFYSHSNWVELHLDVDPIPVWDLAGSSLPSDVVSGTWVLGRPKNCRPGTPSHSELNKDDAHSDSGREIVGAGPHQGKTLFDLASDVAVRASVQQLGRLRDVKVHFLTEGPIAQQLWAHDLTAEALVGLAAESSRFCAKEGASCSARRCRVASSASGGSVSTSWLTAPASASISTIRRRSAIVPSS